MDDNKGNMNQFSLGMWALVACMTPLESPISMHIWAIWIWLSGLTKGEGGRAGGGEDMKLGKDVQREGTGDCCGVSGILVLAKCFMCIFKF